MDEDRDGVLVEMKLRSDGISVFAKAYDQNGKEMALPAKVVFCPQFFSIGEQVRLGTVEIFAVKDGEKALGFRSAMDVSGRSGTLKIPRIEEKAAVIPMFMSEQRVLPEALIGGSS